MSRFYGSLCRSIKYSTTATYLASKEIEIGEKRKIRAITPFKVIQGHPRSSRSVPIECPYATKSYTLTVWRCRVFLFKTAHSFISNILNRLTIKITAYILYNCFTWLYIVYFTKTTAYCKIQRVNCFVQGTNFYCIQNWKTFLFH